MKTLLIVVALGAGIWFFMTQLKKNAEVQKMAAAPERYTTALQNDVSRARAAEEIANKAIKQETHEAEKAVDAQ